MRMEEPSGSRCEAAAAVLDSRKAEDEADCSSSSSSSSSSIGEDSDVSSETESGENEAQSAYNGPLDMMDSLQQVLPIRRGISKFYNGKSKSFTSLGDASCSPSVKDIAKPENAYSRRRRNLMAFNHVWDKLKSNGGGISKRSMSSSRSAMALAFAMNYDSTSSCTSEDSSSTSSIISRSSPPPLPPLHPRNRLTCSGSVCAIPGPSSNFPAWRSFSVADLQHCATAAAAINVQGSSLGNEAAHGS